MALRLLALVGSVAAQSLPFRGNDPPPPFYRDPPTLECSPEGIQLHVVPIGNFSGHVYAKGFFFSETCHSNFVSSPVSSPFVVHIPYRGDCGVRRHHQSRPTPAVSYEVTVVVQRHPLLVTAGDRAYRLSCVYRQIDATVSQRIDVKDLTTIPVNYDSKRPLCRYDVLAQTLGGQPLHYANVGDTVVHQWTCDSEAHGFLVHSCVVRNDGGEEYQLVDERGCVVDGELVPDLQYNEDLSLVHTTIKAFRFADQIMVHFSCQITLCRKAEQGCEGIAPPTCNPGELKPVPVEYRQPVESTTADWQKVISDSLLELATASTTTEAQTTYARSAVHTSHHTERTYKMQEAETTPLPFDSSKVFDNNIHESEPEPEHRSSSEEKEKERYGLEIVDASSIEEEAGLPSSWTDVGKGYHTKDLKSTMNGLPDDETLPFPEAANVFYGHRRPRSHGEDGENITVEVEAAELAVFTRESPVGESEKAEEPRPVESETAPHRLTGLQASLLAVTLLSEMILVSVIFLQRHFYQRSIQRLKVKQGSTEY